MEKLISKIQKLLALANHPGTSEEEAAVAMTMAQNLLAEHNLTMSQVEEAGVSEGRTTETVARSALYEYHRDLMRTLCEVNFCTYWTAWDHRVVGSGRNSRVQKFAKHCLVGRKSNVTTALMLFDYINQTVERLCPWKSPQNLSKSAISWKEGCCYRIRQRLQTRKQELDEESAAKPQEHPQPQGGSANALVLSSVRASEVDLNHDFRRGWEPGTTAAKRMAREAREAAAAQAEAERLAAMTPEERAAWDKKQAEEAERSRKQQEKWQKKWDREWEAKWDGKDMDAFWSGHDTGDTVGLDGQIANNQSKKLGAEHD